MSLIKKYDNTLLNPIYTGLWQLNAEDINKNSFPLITEQIVSFSFNDILQLKLNMNESLIIDIITQCRNIRNIIISHHDTKGNVQLKFEYVVAHRGFTDINGDITNTQDLMYLTANYTIISCLLLEGDKQIRLR